jgi:filamentous hemagglutinin family protein
MPMKLRLFCLLLIISLPTPAQITTDGTLGPALNLQGPDYQIGPDLGQQHGGNLFHSFQYFNLTRAESATFSGPNSVNNVISRVTGGNPSNIDGTIRSTIPNADMYFLNPSGILFGPNARLDVQGSFHASTADYLRLGEKGRFDARNPSDTLLTVAPIESFGFLTDLPAAIVTQDSDLSIPDYQTLSLIGGDLSLNGHLVFDEAGEQQINFVDDPIIPLSIPLYSNQLLAPSGRINLVSVASKGDVTLTESNVLLEPNMQGGKIAVNKTDINVNGEQGHIVIRGEQFQFHSSHIQNQNLADQVGGIIDIEVGQLVIQGGRNHAGIQATSRAAGPGGTITIQAKQITASDGFTINANSYHLGDTGVITIKADTVSLLGQFIPEMGIPSGIFSVVIGTDLAMQKANTGSINLEVNHIELLNGAEIGTVTFGLKDGAPIYVNARDSLTISGAMIKEAFGSDQFSFPSGFITNIYSGSGILNFLGIDHPKEIDGREIEAGNIHIKAGHIEIKNGGVIMSETLTAKAGHITIQAEQLTITDLEDIALINLLSGDEASISATTRYSGPSGNIQINLSGKLMIIRNLEEEDLSLLPDSIQGYNLFPGIYTASTSPKNNAGMAGTIVIQAHGIEFNGHGLIATDSENGYGGNIILRIPHLLYMQEGEITTSVHGGKGDGGNIMIENPHFVILDKGQIKAQADAGQGGNIHIAAKQFINSPDSLISGSSRLGLDGEVRIDSPAIDLDAMLVVLPGGYVEAQLRKCNIEEELENPNRFIVKKRHRLPPLIK